MPTSADSNLPMAFASAMKSTPYDTAATPVNAHLLSVIMDNLREGVVVTDKNGNIKIWNKSVENLTGLAQSSMIGNAFSMQLMGLSDEQAQPISREECPWRNALKNKQPYSGSFLVIGRSGRESRVELDVIPLRLDSADSGNWSSDSLETLVLLHDASIQNNLKRQLKDLFQSSMVDPLTKVFNRIEFERVLQQFVQAKKKSNEFKCSLIVCDIDFFKAINDNYNHHVGDQALIAFADLLKKFIRSHDIVARFGGEEFLILCGNCDQENAVARAEEIRMTLTRTAMPMLDGKCVTASFGVAELKENETPTELFVRADSALFQAKESGRNRVVPAEICSTQNSEQLDSSNISEVVTSASGLVWKERKRNALMDEEYVTITPLPVLIEKVRGYVMEYDAKLLKAESDYAKFQVALPDPNQRGRIANLIVEIEFQLPPDSEDKSKKRNQTYIHIVISEGQRKWFSANAKELALPLLRELRRFFMINDEQSRLTIDRAVTKSTRVE